MRRFLFLALFGLCQLTLAAENELPVQDADQQDDANSSGVDSGDSPDLIAAEIAEIDEDEDEEDSSERFIPTEQISQDLGVSFPVDI